MSLYYTLEIATTQGPEEITQILASEAGLEQTGTTDLRGQAVTVSVGVQDEINQTVVYKDYGFRPTILILLYLHPSDGYEAGKNEIARTTAAVLSRVSGDAALFYNGEVLVFQRMNGYSTIKEGWGEWLTPHLNAAGISYEQHESTVPMT